MYIKKIYLQRIRKFHRFEWKLDMSDKELAGWHVFIGDNGSGKSTILKAIALVLVGEGEAQALRDYWQDWLPVNETAGYINLEFYWDNAYDEKAKLRSKELGLAMVRTTSSGVGLKFGMITDGEKRYELEKNYELGFSAAYGPFRRFLGGKSIATGSKRPAHLSVFGEEIALSETLDWLRELRFKELEKREEGKILDKIRRFINQQNFLPHGIQLGEVNSEGVFFHEASGTNVPVENLGDGYRSILSMVFDIIRQMQIAYKTDDLFSEDGTTIVMPGVVLIDEIDAHLHPEWQRTIGNCLTKLFPKIQFIVSTHSPLVCQAAVKGSIWRLPAPDSDEEAYQIKPESEDWKRLVYGDVLEAYSTDLFGENIDRSEEAQALFKELGELSVKEMEEALTVEEEKRLDELMKKLPSTPYRDTVEGGYD
jgi:predicted ATPase